MIWSAPMAARRGFNQIRWDLITARAKSPQPYFFRYDVFADAGSYEVQVYGEGINLRGEMSIVERKTPDGMIR